MEGDIIGPCSWQPAVFQDVVTMACILSQPNSSSPALEAICHENGVNQCEGCDLDRLDVTICRKCYPVSMQCHLLASTIPYNCVCHPGIIA